VREQVDTYYLALLRVGGCTADAHVTASVFGDEIAASSWFATVDAGRCPLGGDGWPARRPGATVLRRTAGHGVLDERMSLGDRGPIAPCRDPH
jgi:hypothetical protein